MTRLDDLRDLDNLITQLHDRHRVFYYAAVILSALGLVGLLCLLRVFKS